MNRKVDIVLGKAKQWQAEMKKLRTILLDCGLTEELKWRKPCYTFQGNNIVIMGGLKEACALGFLKGALLNDPEGVLIKPGENSQSARWMKFTSVAEVAAKASILKAYVREAIEAEKAGLKVEFKAIKELKFAAELQEKMKRNPALKKAFTALTPGRQRAYNMYFSAPKQSKTREARIDKYTPLILEGKGMLDDYRRGKK